MQKIGLWFVVQYQKNISPFLPKTCRYYPSCSEYALWSLKHQNFVFALFKIVSRILRCNQFCSGGIDYPTVKIKLVANAFGPRKVIFWFVPVHHNKNKFFIIKSFGKEIT